MLGLQTFAEEDDMRTTERQSHPSTKTEAAIESQDKSSTDGVTDAKTMATRRPVSIDSDLVKRMHDVKRSMKTS